MLFMKGNPDAPQCGFSRQTVALLRGEGVQFGWFDIFSDQSVREGLKKHNDWPSEFQLRYISVSVRRRKRRGKGGRRRARVLTDPFVSCVLSLPSDHRQGGVDRRARYPQGVDRFGRVCGAYSGDLMSSTTEGGREGTTREFAFFHDTILDLLSVFQ